MRILKSAVIVAAALAAVAGTSTIAHAYPPPKNHHSIDCDPGRVSADGGHCAVTFVDKDKSDKPRAGQTVCFTVNGPGTVTPSCSVTNAKGKAFATYHAGDSVNCKGKDADSRTAVIHGKESATADEAGAAQTRVRLTCGNKDHDGGTHRTTTHHSTTTRLTNAHAKTVAAALLNNPSNAPGGSALGIGILLIIVVLSVAITGRLRLRRLRR